MRIRVLDEHAPDEAGLFLEALRAYFEDMELGAPSVSSHLRDPERGEMAVVFLPGDPTVWTPENKTEMEGWLAGGGVVLPVSRTADQAGAVMKATAIEPINAFICERYGDSWSEALVDEVLTMVWLHRRTRRVFISYRRTDSSALAHQLRRRLLELGFDVFLDECSVPIGVNFQEELFWRLNDVDLVILLASPKLAASRWVIDEINFARDQGIGILPLAWPGAQEPLSRYLTLDAPVPVKPELLTDDQMLPAELETVLREVFRRRGKAIRNRLLDLSLVAKEHLKDRLMRPLGRLGDLEFRNGDGELSFLRLLPHRPDHHGIYALARDASGYAEAGCLYPESHVSRAEPLRWLTRARRRHPVVETDELDLHLWSTPGVVLP